MSKKLLRIVRIFQLKNKFYHLWRKHYNKFEIKFELQSSS